MRGSVNRPVSAIDDAEDDGDNDDDDEDDDDEDDDGGGNAALFVAVVVVVFALRAIGALFARTWRSCAALSDAVARGDSSA